MYNICQKHVWTWSGVVSWIYRAVSPISRDCWFHRSIMMGTGDVHLGQERKQAKLQCDNDAYVLSRSNMSNWLHAHLCYFAPFIQPTGWYKCGWFTLRRMVSSSPVRIQISSVYCVDPSFAKLKSYYILLMPRLFVRFLYVLEIFSWINYVHCSWLSIQHNFSPF